MWTAPRVRPLRQHEAHAAARQVSGAGVKDHLRRPVLRGGAHFHQLVEGDAVLPAAIRVGLDGVAHRVEQGRPRLVQQLPARAGPQPTGRASTCTSASSESACGWKEKAISQPADLSAARAGCSSTRAVR